MELLTMLVKFGGTLTDNKEFITLLIMCVALIKLVFIMNNSTNAMKVQQVTCLGKFNTQEVINTNIKETAEEAKKKAIKAEETADKAFTCVGNISKTVEDVRDDWKKYIAEKHREPLTKTDQKETNNGLKA